MSRNGSGVYVLPTGNPVVPNTTITTTWANNTLNDIASALTQSVAADGQTPMTGNLNLNGNDIINADVINATSFVGNVTYNAGRTGTVNRTVTSKLQEWLSVEDFGAVCDGTTNDTVAIQTAISSIGSSSVTLLFPGPTKINANLTFGANTQLFFEQGAMIIGTSGTEAVIIQKTPLAQIQQIFSNCVPSTSTGMTIFPEWFGAVKDGTTNDLVAFQKALYFLQYVGGLIQLQAGFYAIADQLDINYNRITIQGAGNNISWFKVTGANKNGLKINGVSGTPIRNIMLRDFSIILGTAGSTVSYGLNLSFAAFSIVERIQVQDFLYGVGMQGATNSQITKVGATYTGTTNGFIGFNIYGGASGAASANASSLLKDCYASGVSGKTGQIGFNVTGSYMSDVQFDTCETALTNYGYSLDYSIAPNYNVDIIIRNPIIDRYFTQGILVGSLPSNGCLQIIGGYTNPETLGSSAQNMYFSNCVGAITISGHEFMALTNTIYTDGVYMTGSSGITISGCIFTQLNRGINTNSCGYSVFVGNVFKGGNPSSFSVMVNVVGSARMMINGNSFSGATQGVSIDGTSDGCAIVGNTANVATIGTRFVNSGTNPVGGTNGSTGLNTGY